MKAPKEASQIAVFPLSTMSAFVSLMFFGACTTNLSLPDLLTFRAPVEVA